MKTVSKSHVLGAEESRFVTADFFRASGLPGNHAPVYKKPNLDDRAELDQLYQSFKEMPAEVQKETHVNVLLVLDDVVAEIKRNENNPRLAALVMNRRHLVFNGTVSIIMVTQKYTLIPARIRSNANWMILFQLNPLDFESVYRDVVVEDRKTWQSILSFVFGRNIDLSQSKKEYEQLQAEEEKGESHVKKKRVQKEEEKKDGQTQALQGGPAPIMRVRNPYSEEENEKK